MKIFNNGSINSWRIDDGEVEKVADEGDEGLTMGDVEEEARGEWARRYRYLAAPALNHGWTVGRGYYCMLRTFPY